MRRKGAKYLSAAVWFLFGAACIFVATRQASAATPTKTHAQPPVHSPTIEESIAIMESEYTQGEENNPSVVYALKTNMLFDVIGGINIGLEVYLGSGFSIAGDGAWARWQSKNKLYGIQTFQGSVTGKYWFYPTDRHPGRPLTGWNAGLYAMGGGPFEFQWKKGWEGRGFFSLGIAVGYSLPIHRVLNLEFALAAGYVYLREPEGYDGMLNGEPLTREVHRALHTFLPTKAQINLVWLINYSE